MTKPIGFLVERDGRSMFLRDKADAQWAIDDPDYKVTPLGALDKGYEQIIAEIQEDRDLYMSLCDMLEEENQELRERLKNLNQR